jgi:plasmid maintenance system antidote protein VapI
LDNSKDPRLILIQKYWYDFKLTQKEAATRMKITQPCFNQYLHGKIKLNTDTIIKFAKLFDIPLSNIDADLNSKIH